ncbi:histidinol dehydrogenase-domain-containing protein [Spinellus fusiger]|nr:histidinol dehydrogenase-domain-containing protein [Spinellus fusiger]
MLIPSIDVLDDTQQKLQTSLSYIGSVLLKNCTVENAKDSIRTTESTLYWVYCNSSEEAIQLWDVGVWKVVFDAEVYYALRHELEAIPQERIAVSISLQHPLLEELLSTPTGISTFIIQTTRAHAMDPSLGSYANTFSKTLLPHGGVRRIVLECEDANALTLDDITHYNTSAMDVMVPASHLTVDPSVQDKLNIGQAFLSNAVTDRPDGLYATIVVDERNTALGLVYSSQESVSESIRTGQGVYQSRKHGLWYKGATSGATQTLIRIDYDCDGDALRFIVKQHGTGFCHLNTRTCYGDATGLTSLQQTLQDRKVNAPKDSYTARLFNDASLLKSKIMEEAEELCDATEKEDVAWEAADLIYFALVKCVGANVSLQDIEKNLDKKARKVTRRPGHAKPKWTISAETPAETPAPASQDRIKMIKHNASDISIKERANLLLRPIIDSSEIINRVTPIMKDVRERGDAALKDLTAKFDRVHLNHVTIKAPFSPKDMQLDPLTKAAIDQAYSNIHAFHEAQMDRDTLVVETMPGVVCSRFARPIEKVGLYVPGGTAILPSTTLMLGIPAKVAGCSEIVIATPPRADGTVVPEVLYVAHKVGASHVVLAGGAQAVAAMAYGTETVPKVDKICGPGNQYVTAAKMAAQNDTSCLVAIDMPAGPSEVLVIADSTCKPSYVAADLLSQAEHGVDSQVVLVAVGMEESLLSEIEDCLHEQAMRLPRVSIVRESISKSYTFCVGTMEEALKFSNDYAPEHLILHMDNASRLLPSVQHAGSVFVGHYSPESMGDYASGTNHTLPTYGYSRMYSGVNTLTFVKHITSQELTAQGLYSLGDTVMRLAEIEGLEAHRHAVAVRVADLRSSSLRVFK